MVDETKLAKQMVLSTRLCSLVQLPARKKYQISSKAEQFSEIRSNVAALRTPLNSPIFRICKTLAFRDAHIVAVSSTAHSGGHHYYSNTWLTFVQWATVLLDGMTESKMLAAFQYLWGPRISTTLYIGTFLLLVQSTIVTYKCSPSTNGGTTTLGSLNACSLPTMIYIVSNEKNLWSLIDEQNLLQSYLDRKTNHRETSSTWRLVSIKVLVSARIENYSLSFVSV